MERGRKCSTCYSWEPIHCLRADDRKNFNNFNWFSHMRRIRISIHVYRPDQQDQQDQLDHSYTHSRTHEHEKEVCRFRYGAIDVTHIYHLFSIAGKKGTFVNNKRQNELYAWRQIIARIFSIRLRNHNINMGTCFYRREVANGAWMSPRLGFF